MERKFSFWRRWATQKKEAEGQETHKMDVNEDVQTVTLQDDDGEEHPMNGENGVGEEEEEEEEVVEKRGTISSARFNLWSTMVGGGSLSLPLAFQKSGNALMGPLLLIVVAALTDFCFRILVASVPPANQMSSSYEAIVQRALGPKAHRFSTMLVVVMCYFCVVAYAVLLRDMLEPISDRVFSHDTTGSSRLYHNVTMLLVILLVTPLCSLRTITSLQRFGAAGMFSILILAVCVVIRSTQCNQRHPDEWHTHLRLFPDSVWDILDALPIFISSYVCHYNVPLAYADLKDPTPARVSWWLRSTTWGATLFYYLFGLAGSLYSVCTPNQQVQGNILLDFGEDDPLLLLGKLCLAFTVSMAFPMLVIPPRDIIQRSLGQSPTTTEPATIQDDDDDNDLEEPLLPETNETGGDGEISFCRRFWLGSIFFWSGAALACCVSSIEIVWDLMGSSLSILLSYLLPAVSYMIIQKMTRADEGSATTKEIASRIVCWILILVFTPLMFVSTAYAVYNTFFRK